MPETINPTNIESEHTDNDDIRSNETLRFILEEFSERARVPSGYKQGRSRNNYDTAIGPDGFEVAVFKPDAPKSKEY